MGGGRGGEGGEAGVGVLVGGGEVGEGVGVVVVVVAVTGAGEGEEEGGICLLFDFFPAVVGAKEEGEGEEERGGESKKSWRPVAPSAQGSKPRSSSWSSDLEEEGGVDLVEGEGEGDLEVGAEELVDLGERAGEEGEGDLEEGLGEEGSEGVDEERGGEGEGEGGEGGEGEGGGDFKIAGEGFEVEEAATAAALEAFEAAFAAF